MALTRQAAQLGGASEDYPGSLSTPALRALYNNLGNSEKLALKVHEALLSRQDGWRGNPIKRILDLAAMHDEY